MPDAPVNWNNFFEYAVLTDVGLRRSNNQDSNAVALAGDESHWRVRGHLFMVADGMGAHVAGELASKMAVGGVPHTYQKLVDRPAPDALRQAIAETNAQIHGRGLASADFHGMGTTSSVLLLLPQGAIVGHVGDSRVYRLRGNTLHQLTFDHSLVWEMKAADKFGGGAPAFVPKNIITRSLGPHPEVQVDLEGPFPLEPGDTFLLCSDGLSGQVSDEELGMIMGALPPKEAVRVLVDLANLRGGPDNITVIVVHVLDRIANGNAQEQAASFSVAKKDEQAVHWLVWVVLGVCLLLAGGMAMMQHLLLSVVSAIGALIAGVVALLQRSGTMTTEAVPMPSGTLGRGPHVAFDCTPTTELLSRLAEVVQKLRSVAMDDGWDVKWPEFDAFNERASEAIHKNDLTEAVRQCCLAISFIMAEIRRQRGKKGAGKDSSVIDS